MKTFPTLGPLRSSQNQTLVVALFHETRNSDIQPSFTCKDEDWEVDGIIYPSLKRLYMESMDPTEQKFIDYVFRGNRNQWDRIRNSANLGVYFKRNHTDIDWWDDWRYEMELKLQSLGVDGIRKIAADEEDRNHFTALRYLADKGWQEKRGRPSKAEKERDKKIKTAINSEEAEDIRRMEDIDKKLRSV